MRLFVPLTKTEFDALRELARIERRRPQDQAAAMLAKVLADDPPAPSANDDALGENTPRQQVRGAQRAVAQRDRVPA
jgi:hypothetical protein